MRRVLFSLGLLAAVLLLALPAQARDEIKIVGSSTVYPFASYVTEEFGSTTQYSTPVIESTGSGGGYKLFTEGTGMDTPDVSNASRRMKPSEFDRGQKNGVKEIHEVLIGYDG
ncbi:MAG: substrate-binding domain-containing protein, partial [Desulfohalobiaceae bacterium]